MGTRPTLPTKRFARTHSMRVVMPHRVRFKFGRFPPPVTFDDAIVIVFKEFGVTIRHTTSRLVKKDST